MADDRIALCIEPDSATAEQLRRVLAPHGFEVKNIPNGDAAMEWGRTNKPDVIILSVEPRKIGYAISNKLRRSPSLRGGASHPHLRGGDAGHVRAAQETEVARR